MRLLVLACIGLMLPWFAGCSQQQEEAAGQPAISPPNFSGNAAPNLPNASNVTNTTNAAAPTVPQNISAAPNASASNASVAPAGLEFGNYSLVLEDLLLAAGANRQSCASLAIYGLTNATRLDRLQACPGQSAYWAAPDGHRWRIVVYQTAPGFAGAAKWAEIAVFG